MVAGKPNETAITIIENVEADAGVIAVKKRLNEVKAIHQAVFQKGVHYGAPYKGAKNDTLLKPGATFLQQKYGMHAVHERIETTIHVDPTDMSKSYIIIQNRCRIYDEHGQEIAQADAACTTFEDKYLYRGGSGKTCPDCGGSVMKSKYPDKRTNDLGWYCRDCKANFVSTDERIAGQDTTKSVNQNPLNLLDTIVAMAQKRAEVRATIKATGIDALFSPGDGVTVDYYDDMADDLEKSNEELITIVQKNAPDAPISQNTGTPSDLPVENDKPQAQSETPAKSPAERLGTPSKQTIAPKAENPPAPGWKSTAESANVVFKAVRPLYKAHDHMMNSIKKLEAAGTLTDDMNPDLAIATIQNHKDETVAPF